MITVTYSYYSKAHKKILVDNGRFLSLKDFQDFAKASDSYCELISIKY